MFNKFTFNCKFLLFILLIISTGCKKNIPAPKKINEVLILGNSITIHPPLSSVGWYGNWGMAASTRDKDYSHRLASMLNAEITPVNIAEWERNHTSFDVKQLDPYFHKQYNLVILRLGENVLNLVSFKESLLHLLDYIKTKSPSSKIVITGRFWRNEVVDQVLLEVADEKKILFVKLSHLDVAENLSYLGAKVYNERGSSYQVTHQDVANHPGDLGMQMIAECIFDKIIANQSH